MSESGNGNWIVLARFVANLNLALEILIARPLNEEQAQRTTLITLREKILTTMRIWVVDFCPSGANCCASRRPWHRPVAAASSVRPSFPSEPSKKMGICNTASSTCCLLSVMVCGDHIVWGTTVPLSSTVRSRNREEVSGSCSRTCRVVGPTTKAWLSLSG